MLVTVVWIKEIAMPKQVAAKVFMDTFDVLDVSVLKYHAHIFDITWGRKISPMRNKQSTWKTQMDLNSILASVRIFPVMNSIATINSSWKIEVLNTVKKSPSTVEKVTTPI